MRSGRLHRPDSKTEHSWGPSASLFVMCISLFGLFSCGSSGGGDIFDSPQARSLSLNGTWQIAEGSMEAPGDYRRTVQVPGFADQADPPFAEVGVRSERRDAFWYRREFMVPAAVGPVAILKIHKAKYGMQAWVNGEPVGSHLGAFTLAEVDVSDTVVRGSTNSIVVRVGADKSQVPATIPTGEDLEKELWFPGIWDDIALSFSGEQRIVRVKIEPDIESGRVTILTTIENHSSQSRRIALRQEVAEIGVGAGALSTSSSVLLSPGESTTSQTIAIENPHLWAPGDPFLYVLRTEIRGDRTSEDRRETRFGMRSVEWRSGDDKGFYLNGEPCFLRGSNLSLHRFFQDPERAGLPWDRDWVRRLLTIAVDDMNWNSMRISIGRLPNFWYDLADELGILLADEFMMWSLSGESTNWSLEEMETEYVSWVQENWNHPSIAWWDASNETSDPKSTMVVERVRSLDPTRQWENGGHNPPQGPNDPVEEHVYLLVGLADLRQLSDFANPVPVVPGTAKAPGHPYILNEYHLLWLNRDGLPTEAVRPFYDFVPRMTGGPFTSDEYREAYAYVGAVLTEFWRFYRMYAGVQHFTFITSSPVTGDSFLDVRTLALDPRFQTYLGDAFAPIGIFAEVWEEGPGDVMDVPMRISNDTNRDRRVDVEVLAVSEDATILERSTAETLSVPRFGFVDTVLSLATPEPDRWILFAEARPHDADVPSVSSRRKIGFTHLGEAIPLSVSR